MEPESVKKMVEKQGGPYEFTVDSMPTKFIELIVMQGLKVGRIERGRVLCSFLPSSSSPPDIVGSAAIFTMRAPTTGVSVEINVSYLDGAFVGEEIEIESKVLHAGKTRAVVIFELKNKRQEK